MPFSTTSETRARLRKPSTPGREKSKRRARKRNGGKKEKRKIRTTHKCTFLQKKKTILLQQPPSNFAGDDYLDAIILFYTYLGSPETPRANTNVLAQGWNAHAKLPKENTFVCTVPYITVQKNLTLMCYFGNKKVIIPIQEEKRISGSSTARSNDR